MTDKHFVINEVINVEEDNTFSLINEDLKNHATLTIKNGEIKMNISFERGILQIEDARIIYRNFAGIGSKYNREGDRNFAVIIPNQEIADELIADGWAVKIKPPRDEDESPFMYLLVKVKFNNRGPAAYVKSGNSVQRLNQDTIGMLDEIDIQSVDMDLRAYDWEVNGKTGRSAYLQAINVIQNIDRFGAQYQAQELPF